MSDPDALTGDALVSSLANPLIEAFAFTASELAANRAGQLSERQIAIVQQWRQGGRVMGWWFALTLIAIGLALPLATLWGGGSVAFTNLLPCLSAADIVLIGIPLLVVTVGYIRTADVRHLKVSVTEGIAQEKESSQPRAATLEILAVGGVEFSVYRTGQRHVIRAGTPCRVYYIRNANTPILLSIEKLGRDET